MPSIQIYSTQQCPYCVSAKALLRSKGLSYEEVDVSTDFELLQQMVQRSGNRTVPQLFIDGNPIGGYEELTKMELVNTSAK